MEWNRGEKIEKNQWRGTTTTFEKIDQIDKSLARLIRKKRDKLIVNIKM